MADSVAPAWRLVVDGVDISARAGHRLLGLTLTEKRGAEADELTLEISDHDGRLALPPKGGVCTLQLGVTDTRTGRALVMIDKGSFKIDEVGHSGSPDKVSVRARSADLTGAFRRRRSQSWPPASATGEASQPVRLGDVLDEIAARNGLTAVVAPEMADRTLPHLAQTSESDAAFLARLGRRFDAVATVKAGRLLFGPAGAGKAMSGVDLQTALIKRRDGDQHTYKAADRGAFAGVIAQWRDRAAAETREVVVGSEENARRLSRVYASEDAARQAAEAAMGRIKRGKAEFSLSLARGRPDLFAERPARVSGFKPQIDGAGWVIATATHAIAGDGGLTTRIECELGGDDDQGEKASATS